MLPCEVRVRVECAPGDDFRAADDMLLARRQPATASLPHSTTMATKSQILDWLKSGQKQLVDARSAKEYRGDTVTADRNGAIPGANH